MDLVGLKLKETINSTKRTQKKVASVLAQLES